MVVGFVVDIVAVKVYPATTDAAAKYDDDDDDDAFLLIEKIEMCLKWIEHWQQVTNLLFPSPEKNSKNKANTPPNSHLLLNKADMNNSMIDNSNNNNGDRAHCATTDLTEEDIVPVFAFLAKGSNPRTKERLQVLKKEVQGPLNANLIIQKNALLYLLHCEVHNVDLNFENIHQLSFISQFWQ